MSVRRIHGGLGNQEGMTVPFVSPWGQQLAAHESELIDQPPPIGGKTNIRNSHGRMGFGGTVGGIITISASTSPLVGTQGYYGDLPQSEQGIVDAADPWNRA